MLRLITTLALMIGANFIYAEQPVAIQDDIATMIVIDLDDDGGTSITQQHLNRIYYLCGQSWGCNSATVYYEHKTGDLTITNITVNGKRAYRIVSISRNETIDFLVDNL